MLTNNLRKLWVLWIGLILLVNVPNVFANWGSPIVIDEGKGNVGEFSSMTVVDGHPAIVYIDFTKDALTYNRATNPEGTAWGNPVVIDTEAYIGNVYSYVQFTSLAVVDGYPAIAYMATNEYQATGNMNLRYVRANDAVGASWSSPMILDTNDAGKNPSLLVVNGRPAIGYSASDSNLLSYIRANDAVGDSWGSPVTIQNEVGSYVSMAIINSNPAMSYYSENDNLKFVRALDLDGDSWGTPVYADAADHVGRKNSLAEINGRPAIAYFDDATDRILYVRANDTNGATWGSRVYLDDAGTGTPNYFIVPGIEVSLHLVNNGPAVSYYEPVNRDLKFIHASDNTGANWGTPLILDDGIQIGRYSTLAIVNNNPAISYYDGNNADVKYIRATDVNGTTWGDDVLVDEGKGEGGMYTSLAMINDRPAISYYDPAVGSRELRYVRANDSLGISWGVPITVDESSSDVGWYTTLLTVNGNPAISYYDRTNKDLKYVRALDSGGTTWGSPVALESLGDVGEYASMLIVNGNPAIVYMEHLSSTNLRIIRALDENGATWGASQVIANSSGSNTSTAIINGNPAVVTGGSQGLQYIRANDVNGTTWGTPINLNVSSQNNSLVEVNGRPAISTYNTSDYDLIYMRANDMNGSSWGTPMVLDSEGRVGWHSSMTVVNKYPAVSYYDGTNGSLKYIIATDEDGVTWNPPITLDDGNGELVGQYPSLMATDSGIGVSYFGSLRFIHNDDPTAVKLLNFDVRTSPFQRSVLVFGGSLIVTIMTCLWVGNVKRKSR